MEHSLGPSALLAQVSTLRFPPTNLSAAHFRQVFNRLSSLESFNYTITGEGVEMSVPPRESGDTIRIALGKEAVQVSLDPTTKSVEFAAEQLTAILKEIAPVLPVPVFIHQTHVLRKTLPLSGAGDARSFLLGTVLHIPEERMQNWKRPFATVGLRFMFPPQHANELSTHDLKVESFLQDPAKVFLENTSNFLMPLPAGQWDLLKANLSEANRFLDEHAALLLRESPASET